MADRLTEAIADTASAWREPDYAPRVRAVKQTLACKNRFTREALAFGINQPMSCLTDSALEQWVAGRRAPNPVTVGVIGAGNVPLVSLQDFLAVVLTGHTFIGCESTRSPWLLPAFVEDVRSRAPVEATFVSRDRLMRDADALIATGSDDTLGPFEAACEANGIPASRRLLRGSRIGVAVLDGRENENERVRLAEDVLLHEGLGCRNVAVVFAPEEQSPDAILEALAVFRGTFPAHERTRGTLRMQQAFLAAVGSPHAHGEGMEFLVSRGDPEVQHPCHLRWSPYTDLSEVDRWLDSNSDRIQVVSARPAVARKLSQRLVRVNLGDTQRPPIDWQPDGRDTVAFLADLRAS